MLITFFDAMLLIKTTYFCAFNATARSEIECLTFWTFIYNELEIDGSAQRYRLVDFMNVWDLWEWLSYLCNPGPEVNGPMALRYK